VKRLACEGSVQLLGSRARSYSIPSAANASRCGDVFAKAAVHAEEVRAERLDGHEHHVRAHAR